MLESLLNPRHDLVRVMTAGLLRQIARSPSGHSAVLGLLDGGMAAAERVPHHCTEFFRLLSDLLSTIATAPPEVRGSQQGLLVIENPVFKMLIRHLQNKNRKNPSTALGKVLDLTSTRKRACACVEDLENMY